MKLISVLDATNTRDKMKFIKCLEDVCSIAEDNDKNIQKALSNLDFTNQKETSRKSLVDRFNIVSSYYREYIRDKLSIAGGQLTVLSSLLARDGNCYAKKSWIEQIYKKDFKELNLLSKTIGEAINDCDEEDNSSLSFRYMVYKSCYEEAFTNDDRVNRERKVTEDEKLVLNKLAEMLSLSGKETSAIENLIKKVEKGNIDESLKSLKDLGIIFFVEKGESILISDEMVALLHQIENKILPDKLSRRILRSLQDSELSNILKRHNERIRGVVREDKIDFIFNSDISIRTILRKEMYVPGTTLNSRKARVKEIIDYLGLTPDVYGKTLEERIEILINEISNASNQETKSLTESGYRELLDSLSKTKPSANSRIRKEFEISDIQEIEPEYLTILGITPIDVLYLYSNDEVRSVRENLCVSPRGNQRINIVENFSNVNDKLLDSYVALAQRDLAALKDKSIPILESEIGIKFEECTKILLKKLNLVVDEELKSQLSTSKDKPDVIISIGATDIIICECKTIKSPKYSKYSSVSKQIKSYATLCENEGKRVAQVLIVGPGFTDDFVSHSQADTDVNISLLTAKGLKDLTDAFVAKRKPKFSPNLLTKGGLLNTELFIKNM